MRPRKLRKLKALHAAFMQAIIDRADTEAADYWKRENFRFQHGVNPPTSEAVKRSAARLDATRDALRRAWGHDRRPQGKG
jgi:hypothetical protein